jgi:hypothetical protein
MSRRGQHGVVNRFCPMPTSVKPSGQHRGSKHGQHAGTAGIVAGCAHLRNTHWSAQSLGRRLPPMVRQAVGDADRESV